MADDDVRASASKSGPWNPRKLVFIPETCLVELSTRLYTERKLRAPADSRGQKTAGRAMISIFTALLWAQVAQGVQTDGGQSELVLHSVPSQEVVAAVSGHEP